MRTADEILDTLRLLSVSIEVRGEKLLVEPASRVPLDLRDEMRVQKPALIAALASRATQEPAEHDSFTALVAQTFGGEIVASNDAVTAPRSAPSRRDRDWLANNLPT